MRKATGDELANPARILLPIHPGHAEHILDGTKLFEFRRVISRRPVIRIVLYATAPVMAVVGEAGVLGLVSGMKAEVWEAAAAGAGISRDEFDAYYADRDTAMAYRLGGVTRYREARPLAAYGVARAPQSFIYLG